MEKIVSTNANVRMEVNALISMEFATVFLVGLVSIAKHTVLKAIGELNVLTHAHVLMAQDVDLQMDNAFVNQVKFSLNLSKLIFKLFLNPLKKVLWSQNVKRFALKATMDCSV